MSFLDRVYGKVFASRKSPRGNRNASPRKPARRLTLEHMETRMLMSANPIGSAAAHDLGHFAAPALFAGMNQQGTGLAAASAAAANLGSPLLKKIVSLGIPHVSASASPTLTATTCSTSQINLTWNAVSGATTYFVVEKTAKGWKEIALLPSGAAGFSVKGLNANTTYEFKVAAQNSAGGTWSNLISAKTSAKPTAPAAPSLTAAGYPYDGNGELKLSWTGRPRRPGMWSKSGSTAAGRQSPAWAAAPPATCSMAWAPASKPSPSGWLQPTPREQPGPPRSPCLTA